MLTHQPTPDQLRRLENARIKAGESETRVAEARAALAMALADRAEVECEFQAAITAVLYGPETGGPDPAPTTAYELSSPLAQQNWPSPRPAPGG